MTLSLTRMNVLLSSALSTSAGGHSTPSGPHQSTSCEGLVAQGTMATTRAGKPVPPSGFGHITKTMPPASGTLSRLASISIW